jgi:ribonuclease VapC
MFEPALALSDQSGTDLLRHSVLPFPHERMPAAAGFHRFGKGRHRSKLNRGDCMTYATGSIAAMPLLLTGGDFTFTDLDVAYSYC